MPTLTVRNLRRESISLPSTPPLTVGDLSNPVVSLQDIILLPKETKSFSVSNSEVEAVRFSLQGLVSRRVIEISITPEPGDYPAPATPSANGLMPADVMASLSSVDLETGVAPLPGYLYRGTGVAGVVVKAQADTEGHRASILGVGHALLGIAPWSGTWNFKFTEAPEIHGVAWLSSTVAGKLTGTAPTIAIPIGVVVKATTVGGDYSADVRCPVVQSLTGGDWKSQLLEETKGYLGGDATNFSVIYDDFDKLNQNALYGYQPNWGQITGVLAPLATMSPPGMFRLTSQTGHGVRYMPGTVGNVTQRQWLIAGQLRVESGDSCGLWLFSQSQDILYGIDISYPPPASGSQWRGGYGIGSDLMSGLTNAGGVDLGAHDHDTHWLRMRSMGDGTVQWRVDNGSWSSPVSFEMPGVDGSLFVFMYSYEAVVSFDTFFFALKNTP